MVLIFSVDEDRSSDEQVLSHSAHYLLLGKEQAMANGRKFEDGDDSRRQSDMARSLMAGCIHRTVGSCRSETTKNAQIFFRVVTMRTCLHNDLHLELLRQMPSHIMCRGSHSPSTLRQFPLAPRSS